MKLPCAIYHPVSLLYATLFASAQLQAADDPAYKPELFSKLLSRTRSKAVSAQTPGTL